MNKGTISKIKQAAQHASTVKNWGEDGDNFHDVMTPAVALMLIAALEQAQALATQQGNIGCALLDEVRSLRRNADDKAPELRAQLEEAENRIAELQQKLISPLPIGELLQRLENQTGQKWARQLSVKLPPRKVADDYTDGVFTNVELAKIYNTCRLECSVRIKNAGGTVEGSE